MKYVINILQNPNRTFHVFRGVKRFHPDVNIIYSTPSCYIKAVNEMANTTSKRSFLVKSDDFMPYASEEHSFWTGFYTSRPTSKRLERIGNNVLQVINQN